MCQVETLFLNYFLLRCIHKFLVMSRYYAALDFEFLSWKDGNIQICDVIQLGVVVFDALDQRQVVLERKGINRPLQLRYNDMYKTPRTLNRADCRERISRCLWRRPEKMYQLQTHLKENTYNDSKENCVNPRRTLCPYVGESLTLVTWGSDEEEKIMSHLLCEKIANVKICRIDCFRANRYMDEFEITGKEKGMEIFRVPFRRFEKNGDATNLTETHAAVCDQNHGQSHDALADARMTMCLVRRTCFPQLFEYF